MIPILLWIVGCYLLAALAIHAAGRRRLRNGSETHYVLMADNQAPWIEWYIRRLRLRARRSGEPLRITVVDCASTDETIAIAERFVRTGEVAICRPGGRLAAAAGGDGTATGEAAWGRGAKPGGLPAEARATCGDAAARGGGRNEEAAGGCGPVDSADGQPASGRRLDPERLLAYLQAEGFVSRAERTVFVDLREPDHLARLPL